MLIQNLKLALKFAAKLDPRFYLRAVNVLPAVGGGFILQATNGHMLIQLRDDDHHNSKMAEDARFLIKRDVIERMPAKGSCYVDGGVLIVDGSYSISNFMIDTIHSKFPDCSKFVPDMNKVQRGISEHCQSFQPQYLATALSLCKGVVDTFSDEEKVYICSHDFIVTIMHCKTKPNYSNRTFAWTGANHNEPGND